ncbi:hypothetical protein NJB1907E49_15700, partial [Mycobacterium marinum]
VWRVWRDQRVLGDRIRWGRR